MWDKLLEILVIAIFVLPCFYPLALFLSLRDTPLESMYCDSSFYHDGYRGEKNDTSS